MKLAMKECIFDLTALRKGMGEEWGEYIEPTPEKPRNKSRSLFPKGKLSPKQRKARDKRKRAKRRKK